MSADQHEYFVSVEWQGNRGSGTTGYRKYGRECLIGTANRPPIEASADPAFLGDADRWNPEELLVGSLSACHKLWYLHLCAEAGIAVQSYRDDAHGSMDSHKGAFTEVTLTPRITLRPGDDLGTARALHQKAHKQCFIANSVNFPVHCEPIFE